ncbi:MAG: hypothetical protein U0893_15305 [Chloroflexota bacterium]
MSELIEANPTLEQQMRDWQTERHHRGENPFDWQVFRVVVSYVGACDPGDEAPSEFYWFTPPDGAAAPLQTVTMSSSDTPSARLVAPGKDRTSTLTGMKYWR